jgi:hypothetical protein
VTVPALKGICKSLPRKIQTSFEEIPSVIGRRMRETGAIPSPKDTPAFFTPDLKVTQDALMAPAGGFEQAEIVHP